MFITLEEVYKYVDIHHSEMIWHHVEQKDFQTLFEVREINPVEWFNTKFNGSQTPKEIYEEYAEKWQKKLVKEYRKDAENLNNTRYILVEGDTVIDGWHRMVAFALEGRTKARTVDLMWPKEDTE